MSGYWWEIEDDPVIEQIPTVRIEEKKKRGGQTGSKRSVKEVKPVPSEAKRDTKREFVAYIRRIGIQDIIVWGRLRSVDALRLNPNVVAVNITLLNKSAGQVYERVKDILFDKSIRDIRSELPKVIIPGDIYDDEGNFIEKKHQKHTATGLHKITGHVSIIKQRELMVKRFQDYFIVGMKQCWNCGIFKEAHDFPDSRTTGDGLSHTCEHCTRRIDYLWGSGLRERMRQRYEKKETSVQYLEKVTGRWSLIPKEKVSGIRHSRGAL